MEKKEVEKIIGYNFKDASLLTIALTHTSFANFHDLTSYERLEFLGDSVLGFIVREYLFLHYKNLAEGKLTKVCSALVCEETLSKIIADLKIDKYIKIQQEPYPSILCDVYESILGAIYLDGGIENAKKFVELTLRDKFKDAMANKLVRDYKSEIHELAQANKKSLTYEVIEESGEEHFKTFIMQVVYDGEAISQGEGRSKKAAEQEAAKSALEKLTNV